MPINKIVESPRKLSTISLEFRNQDLEAKYKSVLALCEKLKTLPRAYETKHRIPDEYERVRAQFYINKLSAKNRGELPKSEWHWIDKIEKFLPIKTRLTESLNAILKEAKKIGAIPKYVILPDGNPSMHWSRIKQIPDTDLSVVEILTRDAIELFTPAPKKSQSDKLRDVLNFCNTNGRTPNNHSSIVVEKQLADLLVTTNTAYKKHGLDADLLAVYKKIIQFKLTLPLPQGKIKLNRLTNLAKELGLDVPNG